MTQETENPEDPAREEIYLYKDAGLIERHGAIPLWLKLVGIGLVVWTVYYTIRYWSVG